MRAVGRYTDVMSPREVETIHRNVLRILAEVGMVVEHAGLLERLRATGAVVDAQGQRARFPVALVKGFLAQLTPYDWESHQPSVRGWAGIYNTVWHVPGTDRFEPWTEQRIAEYIHLARALPHVGRALYSASVLPCPPDLQPLYERYYAWKYGAAEGATLHPTELAPYILEMYETHADALGQSLADVFRGGVYLIPPLKLGHYEAEQVMYFQERGLRVRIGHLLSAGANSPVTLAGTVALSLAEDIAIGLLQRALTGESTLRIAGGMAAMDMRTMIRPYGRPEMGLMNMMAAQMARYYRASYSGQSGLTDAKLPSCEAAAQRAITALPTLLAGGDTNVDCGLLSTDEVCSPIQLILDNELLSAIKWLVREFEVSDESIGFEAIAEAAAR